MRVTKSQRIAFFDLSKRVASSVAFDSRMYSCVTEVIVTHERMRNETDKPSVRRIAVHLRPARNLKVLFDEIKAADIKRVPKKLNTYIYKNI